MTSNSVSLENETEKEKSRRILDALRQTANIDAKAVLVFSVREGAIGLLFTGYTKPTDRAALICAMARYARQLAAEDPLVGMMASTQMMIERMTENPDEDEEHGPHPEDTRVPHADARIFA